MMKLLNNLKRLTTHPPAQVETPSFTQQWFKAGLFNFGKATVAGTDYFNCGIIERHDGRWLVTRRCKYSEKDKLGMNDLVAFKLDGLAPSYGVRVDLGIRYEMEHYEDPRVFYLNGRLHVSCCTFIRNRRGCNYPHQILCEVNDDWKLIRRYDVVCGSNGNDTWSNTRHEKNWTYFSHEGKSMLLYTPHFAFELNTDMQPFEAGYEWHWKKEWVHGQMRGGTPPVLVGDEYWTFFHSSTEHHIGKRQYHMGAYAFEAKAPFKPTRITREPLLSGSIMDGGCPGKPPCVFACGALLDRKKWLVTFGVNDHACGWVEIPMLDLTKRCVYVS